jgi:hypothetical protein
MDLYTSNAGLFTGNGNMRMKEIDQYNSQVSRVNSEIGDRITGLKEQAKENEFLASGVKAVTSAMAGASYNTKLAEYQKFREAGGKGWGINDAYKGIKSDVQEVANKVMKTTPEGVVNSLRENVVSPMEEHLASRGSISLDVPSEPLQEGRGALSQAEHVEQMGSSLVGAVEEGGEKALATTGKWAGKLGTGIGIVGGLASGGMAIADDFKGGFHIAGDNLAEKVANVGQITGAVLDVAGTLAPPLALLGAGIDIVSGIIGGIGNIEEGQDKEKQLDKTGEAEKVQAKEDVVRVPTSITTGRTQ